MRLSIPMMNVLTTLLHIILFTLIYKYMESTEVYDDVVLMPKKAFKKEHKKLTQLLGRTQKALKKEASDQKKEMKSVVGGMERDDDDDPRRARRREALIPPRRAEESLPARINRRRVFYVGVLHQLNELRKRFPESIVQGVIRDAYGASVLNDVLALEAAFSIARLGSRLGSR
jgi:hypothetical protein